jgi:cytochrome c peroxidase
VPKFCDLFREVFRAAILLVVATSAASAQPQPNTNVIDFGRSLFFDPRLSIDGKVSCASCHRPDSAYADARATPSMRTDDTGNAIIGARNTPSLLATSLYTRWSWDGRNGTLEAQVLEPLFSRTEHGFRHAREITSAVARDPSMATAYKRAFGESTAFLIDNIALALAQYVRSLSPALASSERALTEIERHGRKLFNGDAKCATCHNPSTAFTDNAFHLRHQGEIAVDTTVQNAMNRLRLRTLSSKYQRTTAEPLIAGFGAFAATLDPADLGKFRTPSLLYVSRTAPYMHDGSIATLNDAVRVESKRGGVTLLPADIDALVAYLQTLGAPLRNGSSH